MGFGGIVGQVIIFLTIVVFAGTIFVGLNNFSIQTSESLRMQKEQMVKQINTEMEFSSINFDTTTTPCKLDSIIKNKGNIRLNPKKMEIYVDGDRISKTNHTITIINDSINPALWDPGEYINLTAYKNLEQGSHSIKALSYDGYGQETIFTAASGCVT